jgi:hypothetical protein
MNLPLIQSDSQGRAFFETECISTSLPKTLLGITNAVEGKGLSYFLFSEKKEGVRFPPTAMIDEGCKESFLSDRRSHQGLSLLYPSKEVKICLKNIS